MLYQLTNNFAACWYSPSRIFIYSFSIVISILATGCATQNQPVNPYYKVLDTTARTRNECISNAHRCLAAEPWHVTWTSLTLPCVDKQNRCIARAEKIKERDEEAREFAADQAAELERNRQSNEAFRLKQQQQQQKESADRANQTAIAARELPGVTSEMRKLISSSRRNALISAGDGTLIWPTEGGIEQWGFDRPPGCASSLLHLRPWLLRIEEVYWGGQPYFSNKLEANPNFFNQEHIIRNQQHPGAVVGMQKQLIFAQDYANNSYLEAKNYLGRLSLDDGDTKRVVDEIRTFSTKARCHLLDQKDALSISENFYCKIISNLIGATDRLETVAQYACRSNIKAPTYSRTAAVPVRAEPRQLPQQATPSTPYSAPAAPNRAGLCGNGRPRPANGVCTAQ